ncbi:hypothetical protein TREMEDRAFT_62008 [Tremella mesenterica DSM 1558]|uniref:uncharacterized protein n=1 Tax=Tremella mesenterica (strain ATCC 24925 / CBS 8224 / DSM 1558 / NBRC 9311 / NRRL Y-6157 / RJB 2259-6 / UBC 559-6) TaxID=578456 RepID=UPI0003F48DD0|nr:uncharacterized protein TREMEDRAFT_62008 [Tremella mesenterica DSM 1558]EIW70246.1 hypothetical protein TREMEDRAFT_62008 [Tremella mesenterica DSM 1558]
MTRRRSATSKARDTKQPTTLESIAESPADEIKSTPSVQTETQTPTETDPPNEETSTQNQQETMTQIQNQDEDFSSSYHRHTRLKFTISSPREFGKVERTSLRFNVDSIESYQQVISALSATLPDDLIAFGRLARTDDPVHGSLLNHESKGKQWIELNKLAINIEHSSKSSDSYQSTTSAGTIMIDEDDEDFERLIEVDRVLMRDDKGRMRTISVVMPSGSIDTSKLTSYQVNKTNGVEPTQIQTQMSSIPQTNLNSSVSQRPTTTKPRNIQEGQNVPRKSSVGANTKIPLNTQSSVVQSQGHVTKSNITRVPPPGRSTKMTRGQPPTRSNISNQHKEPSMVSYIPQDSQNQRPSIPPPPSMNTTHIPSMNNSRVPARTNPHPPRKGPEPSSKPSEINILLFLLIKVLRHHLQ